MLTWLYIFSLEVDSDFTGANKMIVDIRYWCVVMILFGWGGLFLIILAILSDTNLELKQHEVQFLLQRLSVREKRARQLKRASTKESDNGKDIIKPQHRLTKKMSISAMTSGGDNQLMGDETTNDVETIELKEDIKNLPWKEDGSDKKHDNAADANKYNKLTEERRILAATSDEQQQQHFQSQSPDHHQSYPRHTGRYNIFMPTSQMMEMEELDDLMDTAVMILEAQVRVNPRKFLGATASWNLVKSFLFGWATLVGYALSVAGVKYS
jgi:hypothetical protein